MKHLYPLLLTLFSLLILPYNAQVCSLSSSSSDLLQSGQHVIYNGYSNNLLNREHSYTFTVSFAVPSNGLQVAACKNFLI